MNAKIVITISAFTALVLLFFIACSATDLPVIQPRLENASVYPDNGTWNRTFDYTVNCSFSKKVNITLEVYDLSLLDWRPVERGTYNETEDRKWHITWKNIKICSDECAGTSRYRFKYNGSVVGEPYFDPKIIPKLTPEIFRNDSVDPPSGLWNDSFDYSVEVNLSEKANIRLEVFDTRSGEWDRSIGSKPYNKPNTWLPLQWRDVRPFSTNCTGVARYRFVSESGKHESEIYYGPMLINVSSLQGLSGPEGPPGPPGRGGGGGGGGGWRRFLEHPDEYPDEKENFKILVSKFIRREEESPKRPELIGSPWVIPETSWKRSFNYNINVKHSNRAEMWLTLEIYSPGRKENITIRTREIKTWMYNKTTNITKRPVEWKGVKIFTKEDAIAAKAGEKPKYYIYFDDGNTKEIWGPFTGPNITNSPPILTNPYVDPEGRYEDEFKYKVKVMDEDSEGVNVTLHILNHEGEEIYNETKYATEDEAKRGEIIDWTYNEFAEEASNKTFKYYFNATDGIDFSAATKKHKGPEIKFVPPVRLKAHELYPDSNGWWDEFLYKAWTYNPTEDNVPITLEVYVPSEDRWKMCGDQVAKPGKDNLSWSVKPFSVTDFNSTSEYKFTVKGGPLNYEEREEFPGPKIEDVFGIKHLLWRG